MVTPSSRAPESAPAQPGPAEQHPWLDHLPLPAGLIRAGRFAYVNRAFLELTGHTRESATGLSIVDNVAAEDRERILERHAQRMRGEQVPSSYEFHIVRTNGERRVVEIFVATLGTDTLFQLHDVTERDRRQEALRALVRLGAAVQREQDDGAIFERVAEGLNAMGTFGLRLVPSPGGLKLLAALAPQDEISSTEAILGRPIEGMVGPSAPEFERAWREGAAYVDDPNGGMLRFFQTGSEHLRAHGAARGISRAAVLRIDVHGQPRELLMVLADWPLPEDLPALQLFAAQISAALDAARAIGDLSRRNAELSALNRVAIAAGTASELVQLYERGSREIMELVGAVAVAVYLLDGRRTHAELAFSVGGTDAVRRAITRVSLPGTNLGEVVESKQPRVWRLSEYPPDRQKMLRDLGQSLIVSVPMMVRSRVVGVVNLGFAREREVSRSELEILAAMGVHLAAAVETSRLVEDLRRSYEDLSVAHAQLVEQERLAAIGEMAAAVAHEVRNPLGVIFNALSSLRREGSEGPGGQRLVEMLGEEAERINHLVNDLLVFARPARPEVAPGVALGPLLGEAVRAAVEAAPAPVQLDLQVEPGLEQVSVDARLMRQVFLNVAQNAVQAMPRGGTLAVRAAARTGRPGELEVEFRDSGAGIAAEVLPRIFEPFFTTRARGTGLGLALVKRIVEGHRGQVEAESAAGKGTVVRIRWPGLDPAGRTEPAAQPAG